MTTLPTPVWHNGPKGRLTAEIGEFRLEVFANADARRTARFTVLRRQYGQGSLFAVIDSGTAADLAAALHAAELAAHRFL